MTLRRTTLAFELSLASGDDPPAEFCVFKPGMMETTKGVFKFSAQSLAKCMEAAATYGNDFMIDYNHASFAFISADPAEAGKAAGWFTPLSRDGALYASAVRWTPKAKAMLAAREYRYFSPTFLHSDDGEIQELVNVALTNMPATKNQDPLMASRGAGDATHRETHHMEPLLALLGLAASASQADAVATLNSIKALSDAVLALTGAKTPDLAKATLLAWQQSHTQVAALTAKLGEFEAASNLAQLSLLIDQGKRDGKVSPAMEAELRKQGIDFVRTFLSIAAPVLPKSKKEPVDDGSKVVMLTAEDQELAKQMGNDPKKLAEIKAKHAAKGSGRPRAMKMDDAGAED